VLCFISFHAADIDEVAAFIDAFGDVFIPKNLGISEDDPWINSDDDDYIKEQISGKYMSDSTVTILLVGKCTWARQFVDWEIAATLRNSKVNKRSGLLAYRLPSAGSASAPPRLLDNYIKDGDSYARYYELPSAQSDVRRHIQAAFDARETKDHLIAKSRDLQKGDFLC